MTTVVPVAIPDPSLPPPDASDMSTWPARMAELVRWLLDEAAPGMSAQAAATYQNALEAILAANMAQAAANYSGVWSTLTGALAAGRTVFHADKFWVSLQALANVTTVTPGTNPAVWWPLSSDAFAVAFNATTVGDELNAINAKLGVRSGLRNKVVNAAFKVNQGAVSGTVVLAAGAYGHDQWRGGASGCTYTFATSGGVTTITITAGSLVQPIDGAELETGTHVLSWVGTSQGRINAGAYGASGVTGALTGGTNATIEFGLGTVAKVQLEPGTVPSPFERIPDALDLMNCQRYWEAGRVSIYSGQAASYRAGAYVAFNTAKRTTPTLAQVVTEQNGYGAPSLVYVDRHGFRYDAIASVTTADGRLSSTWTANARLP